jgi:hypothetical protein
MQIHDAALALGGTENRGFESLFEAVVDNNIMKEEGLALNGLAL